MTMPIRPKVTANQKPVAKQPNAPATNVTANKDQYGNVTYSFDYNGQRMSIEPSRNDYNGPKVKSLNPPGASRAGGNNSLFENA